MIFTSTTQTTTQPDVERIKSEINRIMEMRAEIEGLEQQEKEAAEKAAKQQFPDGEVADLIQILALNRISEILEPKYYEYREAVSTLRCDVTPINISIGQHFINAWIRIEPGLMIRFPFHNCEFGLEVKTEIIDN